MADKSSSINLWDRSDYVHETSRQLQHQNIYQNVSYTENVAKSNNIFDRLCSQRLISEKELKKLFSMRVKHFSKCTYYSKRTTNSTIVFGQHFMQTEMLFTYFRN